MKKFLFLFFVVNSFSYCQTKVDKKALKTELDSIYKVDQTFRSLLDKSTEDDITFLKKQGYTLHEFKRNSWPIINKHDSLNLIIIEKIIKKHGYPGKSLVGEPTNKAAWYVIQHSDKINKYLPIIEKAGKENEIPMTLVAMMKDRQLMFDNKEQIYGKQGTTRMITNKVTGKQEYKWFIWPIKNPENINQLRKSTGFSTTVEENAARLDIVYKVYTLEQVKNLDFD